MKKEMKIGKEGYEVPSLTIVRLKAVFSSTIREAGRYWTTVTDGTVGTVNRHRSAVETAGDSKMFDH